MRRWMAMMAAGLVLFTLGGCAGSGAANQTTSQATDTQAAATDVPKAADTQAAATDVPEATDTDATATDAPAADTGEKQKLIVGLDDTFAPMGFRDESSQLVGFDIDLANAVAAELGMEIVFQPINWDAKEMELSSKKIDCIWNGMSRTPAREESMTLSQNYLRNKIVIMTVPEVTIEKLEDLAKYKIGTQAKSSALEVVQDSEIFPAIEKNLSEYGTYDECILDMQAGRIQVMIVDEVLGKYKNTQLEKKLPIAPVDFGEDFFVIGFRKEDTDLCKRVEAAIKAVAASGKGAEISNKWLGADLLLPMQ